MSDAVSLRPRISTRVSPALRCAVCHDRAGGLTACQRCQSRFHEECRRDIGRCPTLGCRAVGPRPLPWSRPRGRALDESGVGMAFVFSFLSAIASAGLAMIAGAAFESIPLVLLALLGHVGVMPALLVRYVRPRSSALTCGLGGVGLAGIVAIATIALGTLFAVVGLGIIAAIVVLTWWFMGPGIVASIAWRLGGRRTG